VQIACTGQRVDLTFRKCVHEDDPFTLSRGLDTIVCTESGCRDKTYSREYNSSGCLTVVIASPTFEHDSTHHLEYSRKLSALVVRLRVRSKCIHIAP
ncbi:hypothetical protein chiPu_0031664, partial [Chiloscyllium punctatum]|nr:hypothetical protein [Chiloscyllium punctatum]